MGFEGSIKDLEKVLGIWKKANGKKIPEEEIKEWFIDTARVMAVRRKTGLD